MHTYSRRHSSRGAPAAGCCRCRRRGRPAARAPCPRRTRTCAWVQSLRRRARWAPPARAGRMPPRLRNSSSGCSTRRCARYNPPRNQVCGASIRRARPGPGTARPLYQRTPTSLWAVRMGRYPSSAHPAAPAHWPMADARATPPLRPRCPKLAAADALRHPASAEGGRRGTQGGAPD